MNTQNLIPNYKRTPKELREITKKGGEESGKVRRARKLLRETLKEALSVGDIQDRIVGAVLNKALKGDTKAFEVIRDTVGEKPKDEVDVKVEGQFSKEMQGKIDSILSDCIKE